MGKKPGVHSIGVGDAPSRIMAEVILCVAGNDIQLAAGTLNTCANYYAGSETAIHAMRAVFEDDS